MGSEMHKLNESFKKRLEEYKSRLTQKELKNLINIDGIVYYFYLNGWNDSAEISKIII